MALRRIHITGGPGSGKTHLGRRLARELNLPYFDLDGIGLAIGAEIGTPLNIDLLWQRSGETVDTILAEEAWLTEGAYLGWTMPLFDAADAIVLMHIPWRLASYRILSRHIRAELARSNRFPGWRSLLAFWLWARRYYGNTNEPVLNIYGTPETLSKLMETLAPYESKLIRWNDSDDIAGILQQLRSQPAWR